MTASAQSVGTTITTIGALLLTHMIVGSIYLAKYDNLEHECMAVWPYCVLGVVYTGIVGFGTFCTGLLTYLGVIDPNEKKDKNSGLTLTGAASLALLIWGCVIWSNISSDCRATYENVAPQLWTLFMVTFWYIVSTAILAGVFILCACGILCCGGASGSFSSRV
jgi:hypothetical protein